MSKRMCRIAIVTGVVVFAIVTFLFLYLSPRTYRGEGWTTNVPLGWIVQLEEPASVEVTGNDYFLLVHEGRREYLSALPTIPYQSHSFQAEGKLKAGEWIMVSGSMTLQKSSTEVIVFPHPSIRNLWIVFALILGGIVEAAAILFIY